MNRQLDGDFEVGLTLSRWAQENLEFLTPVMEVVSFIGSGEVYIVIATLVLWSISFRVGIHLGLLLLLTVAVNGGPASLSRIRS
jgi:hypothetical protein